jgi:hypothetical protein
MICIACLPLLLICLPARPNAADNRARDDKRTEYVMRYMEAAENLDWAEMRWVAIAATSHCRYR